MRISILYFLILISFLSCNKRINVFKTGTLSSKNYGDTLAYDINNKFIVLPVKVDGKPRKMVFDTGSDFVAFAKDGSSSKIKCNLKDANGNVTLCNVAQIHFFDISNTSITDLYSLNLDLPAPFLCFSEGIVGNNAIKSGNWLIDENKVIFSKNPFEILDKQVSLDIFYYDSNRLHSNVTMNGNRLDTCLFDYGGLYDIELSKSYYERNITSLKPNKITQQINTTYGVNGKSSPDTVLRLNCNINFSGFKIDSVNIVIKNKGENCVGLLFLKRFEKVAINNTNRKLVFGNLIKATKPTPQECLFSFDLINGFFVVDKKILNEPNSSALNIGDKFVEINTKKSADLKNYCDFLVFKDSLMKFEMLELKTVENKIIKIINRR